MQMTIDTAYFHHVCIYLLYGMAVVLTFVIVERLVYYVLLNLRAGALVAIVTGSGTPEKTAKVLKRRDLLSGSLAKYLNAMKEPGTTRSWLEDLSASLFIKVTSGIEARLWLLDTIVTAAPLLGLFGTILGIMDTFKALSGGGISDPAAVSRGIADALLATAIGIGVALYGLLGHNFLHRFADHLTEEFKRLILASHGLVIHNTAPDKAPAAAPVRPAGAISDIGDQFGVRAR
jgi:biopolymer transport protein ExbB